MIASVSTVIPCYRCIDTIDRAVASVANQILRPAELILVEDGSGDNTLETLNEIQQRYGKDWVKVIALEQNQGVSAARNIGWEAASHDYIAFLDADDAWHPEKIAVQYTWMRQHLNIVLSGHQHKIVTPKMQWIAETPLEIAQIQQVSKTQLLLSNAFYTSSVMLQRTLKQRFCHALRRCEDYLLWLEIVSDGGQTVVLDFPGTYRFKASFGESGLTQNLFALKADLEEVYRRLWKAKSITSVEWCLLSLWSLAKHYRRIYICWFRERFTQMKGLA